MMIKKCLAISRQKHNVKMILVLVILVGLLLVRYEISCWKEKTSSTSYLRPIEKSIDVKNDVKGVRNMRLQWEIEDLKQQILDLGASGPLPSNGFSLDHESFDKRSCDVPRLIHQTWKSSKVDAPHVRNVRSWVEMNPDWEYRLWTDSDIRLLVARRFPDYLEMFDSYPLQIQRADMFRYFVMYEYGGVYADMDFEALVPLSEILDDDLRIENKFQDSIDLVSTESSDDNHVCAMVSQEPVVHAHVLYHVNRLACNAITISAPGHPFWLHIIEYAREIWKNAKDKSDVLSTTGPKMMNEALRAYVVGLTKIQSQKTKDIYISTLSHTTHRYMEARNHRETAPVHLVKPETFYPFFDDRSEFLKSKCETSVLDKKCASWKHMMSVTDAERTCANRRDSCNWLRIHNFKNLPLGTYASIAVHHWHHTWISSGSKNGKNDCNDFPIQEVISKPTDQSYGEQILKRAEDCVAKMEYSRSHLVNGGSAGGRPGISDSCEEDRKRLCKDVKPGEGRTHKCMDSHFKDLSDACKLSEYGSLDWVDKDSDDGRKKK